LRIGSWNVSSLYKPGALKMLLEQLDSYTVHITAIQEMAKKDHILFYSCQKKDHVFGAGFVVNKRIKHLVVDFKAKSPK
jgi:mRNA deadenylase 3'-5' endonuclease subunit Ccr4